MEDLPVSDELVIQSHRGAYTVDFAAAPLANPARLMDRESHFLLDANVARIYAKQLAAILERPTTILIDAVEDNKSIERVIPVLHRMVANKVRRDHVLVAVGGGIVQDITCFVASTLLRGLTWHFVPTTLLSQADSCIGSKSSINLGDTKNILGTFNPPEKIFLDSGFLETLDLRDIRSGIGEILKVHAIDGMESFDRLARDFGRLTSDRAMLLRYIRAALEIKKRYIEVDEFDQGVRNVFNYGHSFGHAIESATHYGVPHGIAVTMGMDMANGIAVQRGLVRADQDRRMHSVLRANYEAFAATQIDVDGLLGALMKDKKNTTTALRLIFPVGDKAEIKRIEVSPDADFRNQCMDSLKRMSA